MPAGIVAHHNGVGTEEDLCADFLEVLAHVYPPEPKSLTEAAGLSGDAGVKLHRQEALCHECKGLGDEARGAVWAGSLRGSD